MKPISLRMQAFGPYAREQLIDFRRLEQANLYLVCGDTGAGKSTIFDAISYALYDERGILGSQRRSKYADPATETEVEFFFSHHGKTYRILRKPAQEVLKRRGQGTRVVNSSAELTLPDGRVITGTSEVNAAVVEILGLTDRQFKQVIMIAQGKFDEVLHASSAERQAILRNILNTDFYARLQERLKQDVRQAKEDRDKIFEQIKTFESALQLPGREEDADTELLIKTHVLPGQEVLAYVAKITRQDAADLAELRERRETLHGALTSAGTALELVKKADDAAQKKQRLLEEKQHLADNHAAAVERLAAAQAKAGDAQHLRDRASVIQHSLPQYDQAEQLRRQVEELDRQLRDVSSRIERAEQHTAQLQQKMKDCEDEEARLSGDPDRLAEAQQQEAAFLQQGNALADALKKAEQVTALTQRCRQQQDDVLRAEVAFRHAQAADDTLQRVFRRAQAGILAGDLIEGVACPVCGSTSHPAPAVLSGEAPNEAELDKAREAVENAREKWSKTALLAGETKGKMDAAAQDLAGMLAVLLPGKGPQDLQSAIEHTRALWKEAHSETVRLQASCRRLQELRDALPGLREDQQKSRESLQQYREQKIQQETERAAAQVRHQEMLMGLAFPTRQDALGACEQLTGEATRIDAEIRRADSLVQDLAKQLSAKEAAIASKEEEIRQLPSVSLEDAAARETEARAAWKQVDDAFSALSMRCSKNTEAMGKLRTLYESLAQSDARYAWLNALSQTANGQITTKKMTLETFVQLHFFDRILQRANLRLQRMSDGQYSFVRAKRQQGNKDSSLDLDVVDSWNGTQRSVSTLSGGESFQASLALALGFSDEIQAAAGGVQLDTLFIDEGFGTLDETTLNSAIAVLQSLSGGNRQVGIISHVEELQRRIERKIIVRKDAKMMGSIACIE